MSTSPQLISGMVAVCFSFLMIAIALLLKKRAKGQLRWNQVPATVISASVEVTNVISANIEYEYVLSGIRIRGNKVRTLGIEWGFLSGSAHRTVEMYPVGSKIVVFVDPDDASNAVIEPGGDRRFLPFMFVFASIVLYAGIRWILSVAD